ncbi:hypothetical protein JB92DRAFT_3102073 [Gautieria morchelliformis]|nr:hypothetical protein JB92DRAFT_3102073 [Gautieria morchelliformis]
MAKDEVEIDATLERIRQMWKCMMMHVRGLWSTLWVARSLPSTSSNHGSQPPYPYAQPPSQPPAHDSRARGTTPAIDMHPEAELSPLPPMNPHGESACIPDPAAHYFPVPHDTVRQVTSADGMKKFAAKRLELWMKARVLGTIEVGRGRAVDHGRASGGVKDHRGQWTSKDRMNGAILRIWKSYMNTLRQSSLTGCMKRPSYFNMEHNDLVTAILCTQPIGCDSNVVDLATGDPGKPRKLLR